MKVLTFRHLLTLGFALIILMPMTSPAPLIYVPGEGWSYVRPGDTEASRWKRPNAQEQIQLARDADQLGNFRLARRSAKRVLREWAYSDYAAEAQFFLARSYDGQRNFHKAAKEYEKLLIRYPQTQHFDEALIRQYEIGKYLGGKGYFKLWGWVPLPNRMYPKDSVVEIYDRTIDQGPFNETGPKAQMEIGQTRENQKRYGLAVKAYELAADRYHYKPEYAADALYKAGQAYYKQVRRAEYDQSVADRAVKTFGVFLTLYESDPRAEEAKSIIISILTEQVRGNYQIAKFYEARRKWSAASSYYNAAIIKEAAKNEYYDTVDQGVESEYAKLAREELGRLSEMLSARRSERAESNAGNSEVND